MKSALGHEVQAKKNPSAKQTCIHRENLVWKLSSPYWGGSYRPASAEGHSVGACEGPVCSELFSTGGAGPPLSSGPRGGPDVSVRSPRRPPPSASSALCTIMCVMRSCRSADTAKWGERGELVYFIYVWNHCSHGGAAAELLPTNSGSTFTITVRFSVVYVNLLTETVVNNCV